MRNDVFGRFFSVFSGAFSGKSAEDGPVSADSVASLKEEVQRLRRTVDQLELLNELAVAASLSHDQDDIVRTLVDRSMRAIKAEQAVVTLASQTGDIGKTNLRVVASSVEHRKFHMSETLLGWMYIHKKPLIINDPPNDGRFKGIQWDASIRSVLSVPMLVKSDLIGALTIYNKRSGGGFAADDERLAAIIAHQSATVLENSRQSALITGMREQERLACEIQQNLLPSSPPEIEGYEVAGRSIPAQSVGGDYFDYIPSAAGCWVFCVGDVSGKGFPASLLMANLQATLRGFTLGEVSVSDRVSRANRLMCRNTDSEKFATLFYGELDTHSHQLTMCNAGHEPPYLVGADGEARRVGPNGLALGVLDDFGYEEATITIGPGEVLLIFSDGVTDATNKSDELFGHERLAELMGRHRKDNAEALVHRVVETVNQYAVGVPQVDDITLLAVKRRS